LIKKIVALIGSVILLILSLTGCYANDVQQDFAIKSREQADIYFPKYLNYVKTLVDEYNPNYELTTNVVMENNDNEKYFSSDFVFNDRFSLYVSLCHDLRAPSFSTYYIRARYYANDYSDIELFPREIFDIMHKIDEYCVYKLGGDATTYNTLLNQAITYVNVDEKTGGEACKHFYDMRNKNYEARIYWKEYIGQWEVVVKQSAFLTDKNVV
jgi:hypothetical protein